MPLSELQEGLIQMLRDVPGSESFEALRREFADWRDELSRELRLRPGRDRALDTPEPPSVDLGL